MIQLDISCVFGRQYDGPKHIIKCMDSGAAFRVSLMEAHVVSPWSEELRPYTIPEGATAKFRVKRPDRAYTWTKAAINEDGTILCPVHPYSTATPGKCTADVVLFDQSGKRLSSVTFCFAVDEECAPTDGDESPVYVDSIQGLLRTAEVAAERAERAAKLASGNTGTGGNPPVFTPADAGKLLYITADGSIAPLIVGDGLAVVDGALTLSVGTGNNPDDDETADDDVVVVVDADGILHVYRGGTEIYAVVDNDGIVSWPGISLTVDDDGNLNFDKEV